MQQIKLEGSQWTLTAVGDRDQVPAHLRASLEQGVVGTVPGCVHTDLLSQQLITDPYIGDNELSQYWIGRIDWSYVRHFELTEQLLHAEVLELVCEGLDTIGTIYLNGTLVGRCEDMHLAYRFDLKSSALIGRNHLAIVFDAPMTFAESQERIYPDLPREGGPSGKINPHNMLRKMSCNMGWDWGPEVTTSGIWRPIRVEAWTTARINYIRPLVLEATEQRALVHVHVDIAKTSNASTRLQARMISPDGEVLSPAAIVGDCVTFKVNRPHRWWPVGHGAQPLYILNVDLLDEPGQLLDQKKHSVGLRTTALLTEPDEALQGDPIPDRRGESMTLLVNGKRIYCKGANWIPDDCFPHRVTPKRYRERIGQARDANMNMLRVWGGGLYEDHAFYEVCDELGIMVWQDFLFACACYPEEEPYRSLVEAEVRDNVARLCRHPSLVIWNGCNENIWGTYQWSEAWQKIRQEGKRTWGLGYYLDLLPALLAELDPSRPYWPASPYSGSMDRHPNLNEFGNVHIWDVWHGAGQYRNYLAYYPRMATEFGYHGPATYATIERSIPEEHRWWNSSLMQLHNKNARPGQEQTNVRMSDDFVPPTDNFDDWLYLAQVMQSRALSTGIEWFRALSPWNSGALYWQLNDCYPVSSWSAIDGDGRAKPLLHSSRRFFAPRLITIKPRRATPATDPFGALCVYLHNDSDELWTGITLLRLMTLNGQTIIEKTEKFSVPARGLSKFDVPDAMLHRPDCFLVAESTHPGDSVPTRGFWWFSPDKELQYSTPIYLAELSKRDGEHHLMLEAKSVIRELCIFPDRLDAAATISDACVTLLPGDKFTFRIKSARSFTVSELTSSPVLNCVNRFGALTDAVADREATNARGSLDADR